MANRLALIAAAAFAAGCNIPVAHAADVKCGSTGACKGQSACAGNSKKVGDSMSGKGYVASNACRGQGMTVTGPADCISKNSPQLKNVPLKVEAK
jgi:hypothetical protein